MNILFGAFNFLAFEAAWFAAVSGGARGWPWWGSIPALAVVIAHLALQRPALKRELGLILAVTALGVLIETGFLAAGLIRYAGMAPGDVLPPVWIWALWFGFGTLPNASLAWLRGRWPLQALLGAVSGPLTYWAGAKMGAASLPAEPSGALFAIGLAWALALPAIFLLAEAIAPARAGNN
ncbi:DUF2878 domain-containing protein [Aestuariivirga sp.]|uniref:DUF2878 domain-containing protein n=1 Tax=Aestuariivirga sp. TaxID=2650926 RepID=UPI00391B42DA